MRSKTRVMLAIGCVSLLALSIPALSLPSSFAIQRHQAVQKKNAPPAAKGQQNARAAKPVSTKVAEPPQRPRFGWPALVSEARKYLGTNPTARKRLWCATFMNLVLAKIGYAGTNSDAAKSFAGYGRRISEPKVGAIAVLSRGKRGGHVGVVSGIDGHGNPIIISGNHGHRVAEAVYPRARVIAYVMPSEQKGAPAAPVAEGAQVAERAPVRRPASRPAAEPAFEGPITELLAAIEAEQSRPGRPSRQVAPAQPRRMTRDLPLDPALAGLFGLKDRAQATQPPRPVPQLPHGRVALR